MAADYHEPYEQLDAETRDLHRALTSLKEEIEAVDWYHQRVSLCADEELARVLAHNRDEEIEHACMTLEWLRRRVPEWNRQLSKYLYTEGKQIAEASAESEAPKSFASPQLIRSLDIGSLRGVER